MEMTADEKMRKNQAGPNDGVQVQGLDGVYVHSVPVFLELSDAGLTLAEYQEAYPDAPLYSQKLLAARDRKRAKETVTSDMAAAVHEFPVSERKEKFADIFKLGDAPAAKNAQGQDIKITVLGDPAPQYKDWVPEFDEAYVFPIDKLKALMVAIQLNFPMLIHGMHGTGKTTLIENYCAATNRPWIRVQHTVSMEEAHILGHYTVKNGETVFAPGPLPIAMRDGLVYVADEYDFALPSVTSVYQAVLEGKPLIIKEAHTPEWRVVKPHKNFRFIATGNTNGSGDETGLYNGTQIMNAANYSRFRVTEKMDYMPKAEEVAVVASKSELHKDDATRLVNVATEIRRLFESGELSATISPRELISAGILSRVFGSRPDLTKGMQLAYTNRLSDTDKQAVESFMQRHFG